MSLAALEDGELLARARRGDGRAFAALVDRYEPVVAATVIGMLGAGDEADDVGQETFIRFHGALDRYRGDASLRTYLTRIAMNLSLNALRGRKRRRARFVSRDAAGPPPREEAGGDVRQEIESRWTRAAVRRAIDGLAPKHRAVVVLRMIEGRPTRETAEILGVPEGTVMSRLSRAMRHLEDDLGPMVDEA